MPTSYLLINIRFHTKRLRTMPAGHPVILHLIHANKGGKIKTEPFVLDDGTALSAGGEFSIACRPEQAELGSHFRATGEAWLVNCRRCKESAYYKALPDEEKMHPRVREEFISQ